MRKLVKAVCLAFAAALALAASPLVGTQAHADVLVSGQSGTLCVDLGSGRAVLAACNYGGGQNFFNLANYGAQAMNGRCLQGTGQGQPLSLQACNNGQDQQWLIDAQGMYRNRGGWCANVSGGNAYPGAQVVAWQCNGQANEIFLRAVPSRGNSPQQAAALANARPGQVINLQGVAIAHIVAQGGGNIVAQGGGNIVAQGGGNIVAQGGGNAISPTGGNIVAQGGGN